MKKATSSDDSVVSVLTLTELCRFCSADSAWVVELMEYGVVEPFEGPQTEVRFNAPSVMRAKKARRLERDLGINMAGIALILDLLEERDALKRQLSHYQSL